MITVHAQVAIDACEAYIQNVYDRRRKDVEAVYAKRVGTKSWWWSKPMTRDDVAREYADEIDMIEKYSYGQVLREVRALLAYAKVAAMANQDVCLGVSDCSKLQPYIKI